MRRGAQVLRYGMVLVGLGGCGDDAGPYRPPGRMGDASGGADGALTATDASVRSDTGIDAATPLDAWFDPEAAVDEEAGVTTRAGDLTSDLCGATLIAADAVVPMGHTIHVCPGASVTFVDGARIEVRGTLALDGTAAAPISFAPMATSFGGLVVFGSLTGSQLSIRGASLAIDGRAGSTIELADVSISESANTLSLENGGTFARAQIMGGGIISVRGGSLAMIDSVIDLGHPELVPDCVSWSGGGAQLTHVRITGCHCPIHITHATAPWVAEDSIFDGAFNPVMIANATATFRRNHFEGSNTLMLDIGEGIDADVGDNYWEGAAPDIGTRDRSQFRNADRYATSPIAGVGPR